VTDIDLACATSCAFAGDAAWSGDGSSIAYVRRTVSGGAVTSNELVVVDLADHASRRLIVDDRHLLRLPSWEPYGHRIVVERDGGPGAMRGAARTAELVMVDTRDARPTPTRVPGTGTDARDPSWGVNGLIAYATTGAGDPAGRADAGSALVTVDPDSGLSLTVLAFEKGAARVTDPSWWPDGNGLLYGRLAPHAVVPVVRTVNLDTRLEQSATGGETAVGFDPDPRRSTP
jgi:Tol biopolymer transport system component